MAKTFNKKHKKKQYNIPDLQEGDIVLYRGAAGKVWKICRVGYASYFAGGTNNLRLTNMRARNGRSFRAYPHRGDIVFRIPKDTDIKTANIKTLITLYGPNDIKIDIDDNKFFEPSKRYNIQIDSKNKKLMDKIIKLANNEGIKLKKINSSNNNINAKYLITEDQWNN